MVGDQRELMSTEEADCHAKGMYTTSSEKGSCCGSVLFGRARHDAKVFASAASLPEFTSINLVKKCQVYRPLAELRRAPRLRRVGP